MKIVFLLEEPSSKIVLEKILPQIIPSGIEYQLISHQGKSDLKKSIPIKLRGWNEPDVRFLILQDQDECDCKKLKKELQSLCDLNKKGAVVRIVCHELEAWFFGDLGAVEKAYGRLKKIPKFKNPDEILGPKKQLYKMLEGRGHSQFSGVKKIASFMNVDVNNSKSFFFFKQGVEKLLKTFEK